MLLECIEIIFIYINSNQIIIIDVVFIMIINMKLVRYGLKNLLFDVCFFNKRVILVNVVVDFLMFMVEFLVESVDRVLDRVVVLVDILFLFRIMLWFIII